jgi:tRNA-splicing ligase RtcB
VCLDEADRVWVMLHSGSRGIGNAIGSHFITKAKEQMARYFIHLPDKDLACLPEGTAEFRDYVEAVEWAQDFAALNRQIMLSRTIEAVRTALGREHLGTIDVAANCHHNYVAPRAERPRDAEGRSSGSGRRSRHHPRIDGREELYRPWQGQSRQLL